MAKEHVKSWQVGDVTVSRIVELWDFQDNINMTMAEATAGGSDRDGLAAPALCHARGQAADELPGLRGADARSHDRGRFSCIGAGREREFDVFCDLPEGFLEDLESLGIKPRTTSTR